MVMLDVTIKLSLVKYLKNKYSQVAELVANYLNNLITPDRYPLNQDTNIRLCGGDKTGSNPVLTTCVVPLRKEMSKCR